MTPELKPDFDLQDCYAADLSTKLTDRDRSRLNRALGALPFAGGLVSTHDGVRTVDELVTVLEGLTTRLSAYAEREQNRETELVELRRLVRNAQELFRVLSEPGERIELALKEQP